MIKAILTGHSKGLGLGIAKALLNRGHAVLGLSRSSNSDLQNQYSDLLTQRVVDLSEPAAMQDAALHETLRTFAAGSNLLLLINNAGVVTPIGPPTAQQASDIARAIQLNVTVPLTLTALLTQTLQAGQQLRVLHVSSGAAQHAYPGWSVYCATKAALDMHARAIQLDRLGNVAVCSLAPGVIDTDMQAQIRHSDVALFPNRGRFEQLKQTGGLSSPDDTGQRLVAYLLDAGFGKKPVDDLRAQGA